MIPRRVFNFKGWRPKVLVTRDDVSDAGLRLLRESCDVTICETTGREEILRRSKGVDGILWASHEEVNAEALDAAGPQLKVISTMSVGLDFLDLDELKRRNIRLGYTPNVLNDAVADIGFGLAISAARRFHEGRLKIEAEQWENKLSWMIGQEIRGSTVGFVGFGAIGQTVAKKLSGFDVGQFLYCGHNKKPEADKFKAKFVPFLELVEISDFIFIICPLTSETKNMFNSEVFSKMKPTSVLINIARGDIVDQDALYDALKNNKIFAAGLDVTTPEPLPADHPLMTLPNCVITPHLGARTVSTRNNMAIVTSINILAGLAGEPMHSPAN